MVKEHGVKEHGVKEHGDKKHGTVMFFRFSRILKYHHSQVGPDLSEIVFQCPHVRMSFQLRLGAEPK